MGIKKTPLIGLLLGIYNLTFVSSQLSACRNTAQVTLYYDKHVPKGQEVGTFTFSQCEAYCRARPYTCVAFDWVTQNGLCYTHSAITISYGRFDNAGVVHVVFTCPTVPTAAPTAAPPATISPIIPTLAPTAAPVPPGSPIPDAGCPARFTRHDNVEHGFGLIIPQVTSYEGCKGWCLQVTYCAGVNFDFTKNQCSYVRQALTNALYGKVGSIFVFKNNFCPIPTKCYVHPALNASDFLTITNVNKNNVTEVDCSGFCYVRAVMGSPGTYERGCIADATGLSLDCTVNVGLFSSVCYCDTDRCNGLTVDALAAQILHLPLDSDYSDHSGMLRHGETAPGYQPPAFSCLYRAVNCSAAFANAQCISVPSLANVVLGSPDFSGSLVPRMTVTAWVYRVQDGPAVKEGILGNSLSSAAGSEPSWSITGNEDRATINAQITTVDSVPGSLDDFRFRTLTANEWHHVALTYDDQSDEFFPSILPTNRLFIDGVDQAGNIHADAGQVALRNEPVSVGCVGGNNFTGFIDEVHIFGTALNEADIQALIAKQIIL